MDTSHTLDALAGSRIRYREADGRLVLELPARPRRMFSRFVATFVVVVAVLLFVALLSNGWLPAVIFCVSLASVALAITCASLADSYLTKTFVLIATDRAAVETSRFGKEARREFALDPRSRAWQWYSRPRHSSYQAWSATWPMGIEIGEDPYDRKTGSGLTDESKPRFGAGLSRGEMDWIKWRINEFLDKSSSRPLPLEQDADQPAPRPKDTKIRVESGESGSRIIFPNTFETRTFTGVSSVVFFGLVWPAFAFYLIIPLGKHVQTPGGFAAAVLVGGLVSLFVIAFLLNGLTQLFGRRELRITPESITYRAALLGIGLRSTTLRTTHVISIGVPPGQLHSPDAAGIAPAAGCVIRTAEREINYSAAVPKGEAGWVIDEVACRVAAARVSTST